MHNKTNSLLDRLKGKVGHRSQLGGIELATLADGPGRGTRIAWIDTGSGLRYKVLLDRGMDLGEAFYMQHALAWISHSGTVAHQPMSDRGADWLRTFGGGFMTTCGLSHVGGPEEDGQGSRGLHGRISNTPAEIVQIDQPDPLLGKLDFSITGKVLETTVFGPHLMLERTISGTIGSSTLRVSDRVTNRGNTSAPHMLLYHLNFGWPLVDEGADIVWSGDWTVSDGSRNNRIFNENFPFKKCSPPRDEHQGNGEDVAFIDVHADERGQCTAGVYNGELGFALKLQFAKQQLPWLINWQHWGQDEYVMALEPGTNPPIGQSRARSSGTLIELKPGESRSYELNFDILTDKGAIDGFLAMNSK